MNKKIIGAALVLSFLAPAAITLAQSPVASTSESTPRIVLACIRDAVEKREDSVISSWDMFADAVKAAYKVRRAALRNVWRIGDDATRRAAIQAVWDVYHEARQAAGQDFREARRTAWDQFSADRKVCNAPPTGENPGEDLSL